MKAVLFKLFVRRFYEANAGFFLFFFFVFFGAVEGGTLVRYHLSLMQSMLQSPVVLLGVFACWTLYHLKCTGFFFRIFNSAEGAFLYGLQSLDEKRRWTLLAALYTAVYAPVFVYGILLCIVGFAKGYGFASFAFLAFSTLR